MQIFSIMAGTMVLGMPLGAFLTDRFPKQHIIASTHPPPHNLIQLMPHQCF